MQLGVHTSLHLLVAYFQCLCHCFSNELSGSHKGAQYLDWKMVVHRMLPQDTRSEYRHKDSGI
jgi:hypothetical protein